MIETHIIAQTKAWIIYQNIYIYNILILYKTQFHLLDEILVFEHQMKLKKKMPKLSANDQKIEFPHALEIIVPWVMTTSVC